MLEKYEEFKNKKKAIKDRKKQLKKQLNDLQKQNLQIRMDQFNKQKQDIIKKMSKYVAGSSNF